MAAAAVPEPAAAASNGAPPALELASQQQLLDMLARYDACIFDCDGTLWRGNVLIDGATDALNLLRALGKKVIFVTNNSMKSRATYQQKFVQLGIEASPDEIYCSSYTAAAYLASIHFDKCKKVYVVGERGIMDELQLAGYECFGGPDDNAATVSFDREVAMDPLVGAVVCGVDPGLNYYKVSYASLCLRHNAECLFVATNSDSRGHFIETQEWPGAGATIAAIRAAVEMEPVLTGKPAPFLLEEVSRTHGVAPERMLMIGDRLDTDIQWGLNTGMGTLLVLTGITTMTMLKNSPIQPQYLMASVAGILEARQLMLGTAMDNAAAAANARAAEVALGTAMDNAVAAANAGVAEAELESTVDDAAAVGAQQSQCTC